MYTILAVGTFWFWLLISIELIVLFAFIANESGTGAALSVFTLCTFLYLFGGVNIVAYVGAHPLESVGWIAGYLVLGVGWAVLKWYFFVKERLREYKKLRVEFLTTHKQDITKPVPEELKEKWVDCLTRQGWARYGDWKVFEGGKRLVRIIPQASRNKARIMRWIAWWPVSLVWSVISDWVVEILQRIYERIAGVLQRIADAIFEDVEDDL